MLFSALPARPMTLERAPSTIANASEGCSLPVIELGIAPDDVVWPALLRRPGLVRCVVVVR